MESLESAFLAKFPANGRVLQYFAEANGCECTWENLTKVRLQKFVDYLSERIAPNSVSTYCSRLKTVLSGYNEEVDLPRDYQKVLRIKKDTSQHIYLDDSDLKKIIHYSPQTPAEDVIKDWFLIGCLTGARHSDYQRFTKKNIRDGQLHYVSIKTHIKASIPVSNFLLKLIGKIEERGEVHFSDVYFNRIAKRICRRAGIDDEVSLYTRGEFKTGEKWQFVGSHTPRRSFATNLYKQGVDIYTISRLCGHTNVETTKQYICCGPIISNNVIDYFNSFSED